MNRTIQLLVDGNYMISPEGVAPYTVSLTVNKSEDGTESINVAPVVTTAAPSKTLRSANQLHVLLSQYDEMRAAKADEYIPVETI